MASEALPKIKALRAGGAVENNTDVVEIKRD